MPPILFARNAAINLFVKIVLYIWLFINQKTKPFVIIALMKKKLKLNVKKIVFVII